MKKIILIKLLQDPKLVKTILQKLYGVLRDIPVKRILHEILPALINLSVKLERWIAAILEFAMKELGKIPALK